MRLLFCLVVLFAVIARLGASAVKDYLSLREEDFVHMGTIDDFAQKMQQLQQQTEDRMERRPFIRNRDRPDPRERMGGASFDRQDQSNQFNLGAVGGRQGRIQEQGIQQQPQQIQTQDQKEAKFEWGQKAHADIQHEVVFYLTNPHKAFIEQRLKQNPNDPIFSRASMRDKLPPMSRNPAAEQKMDEFLAKIGASIFDRNIATISATAPIHVWEKALRTEFFQLHTNVGERSIVHRAKSYSLPKDVAPHVAIVSGVAEYPKARELPNIPMPIDEQASSAAVIDESL